MTVPHVEVDYLIKGAGATGMAFADTLITETQATMAIVDRHDCPGGHWNDAYSFVRLHQPSGFYGVNSRPLGTGAKDEVGFNKGFYELASGQEVLSHFDLTMKERFLPSGRVQYFPMSTLDDDGTVTALLSGAQTTIKARKFVDGTHSRMEVPSRRKPAYSVAPEMSCIPPNELPRTAGGYEGYVVIGAGKTGMDACIWLLENGAAPERIRWIMPRDSWLLDRANLQPGKEFFARAARDLADQVEALANANSVDDVFAELEARGSVRRIDPSIKPEAYHCAIVSDGELEQLRRIRNVVRLGRVTRIDPDQIVLEQGAIPTNRAVLHIDCSAAGIPTLPSRPVFEGNRITLQWVRLCQPVFSAALIGHVEAAYEDESEKNRICRPIPAPTVPKDWLRMMQIELANRQCWMGYPELGDWMANARLDVFQALIRAMPQDSPEAIPHFMRYLGSSGAAAKKLEVLLAN